MDCGCEVTPGTSWECGSLAAFLKIVFLHLLTNQELLKGRDELLL